MTTPLLPPREIEPGAPRADVVVNGRYELLERGGYQRFAREITSRLDATVVCPPASLARGVRGRAWEQTMLRRATRDRVLFSPANSGPLWHPSQVVVIHDVFALERPEWYDPRVARMQRFVLPTLARGARAVIVPSGSVADAVVSTLGAEAARVHVVHPGVGTPFAPPGVEAAPPPTGAVHDHPRIAGRPVVFGLVSRSMRKNAAHLVDVLSRLADRRPDLAVAVAGLDDPARVVVGDDRPRRAQVIDLGEPSDVELAELYRAAEVFVWLPHAEGFGMPILEAAVAGTSVVTSPVPAVTEVVHDALGDACRIVDPTDADAALAAIDRALASDRLGASDRLALAVRHRWEDRAEDIRSILATVAHETRPSPHDPGHEHTPQSAKERS